MGKNGTNAKHVMRQIFSWPVRIYYEDTDAGGVVYYANYLRYMERARNEWLRDMRHPVEQIVEQEKKQFVIRSVEMKFICPARLGDDLRVSADVMQTKKASMQLKQEVYRVSGESEELLVSAIVELAMVSSENFRPVRLPIYLRDN
jgi:tol-pal system-associated acyl-CoA thioesterase